MIGAAIFFSKLMERTLASKAIRYCHIFLFEFLV
jgi:hypothetical protein